MSDKVLALTLILNLTETLIRQLDRPTQEDLEPYIEIRRAVRKALVAEANRPVDGE